MWRHTVQMRGPPATSLSNIFFSIGINVNIIIIMNITNICLLICIEMADGRTDGRTDAWLESLGIVTRMRANNVCKSCSSSSAEKLVIYLWLNSCARTCLSILRLWELIRETRDRCKNIIRCENLQKDENNSHSTLYMEIAAVYLGMDNF